MLPKEKIEALVSRVQAIDARLSAPIDRDTLVKLSKERAELEPVYLAIGELQTAEREREGLTALLDDPEMGTIAAEEAKSVDASIEELTEKVRLLLLPKDAADEKSATRVNTVAMIVPPICAPLESVTMRQGSAGLRAL